MPVIEQVCDEATGESCRQQCQVKALHRKGRHCKKRHHRNGHRAAEAVDAVGQVYRVDTAYHHEHGEEYVGYGMDIEGHIQERNINIGGQNPVFIQRIQINSGYRHLQHGLLQSCQTQIPLEFDLAEIIQKAHQTKAQAQRQHIKHRMLLDRGNVHQQADDGRADEHQAAHQGCARLAVMPCGANVPHGLSCLQCSQHRQKKITQHSGQCYAAQRRQDDPGHGNILRLFIVAPKLI